LQLTIFQFGFIFSHVEGVVSVGKDFFGLQTLETWMLNYTAFTIYVKLDAQV